MSTTPILDLQEPPPKPGSARWIAVLIGVLIGGLVGMLQVRLPTFSGMGFNGLLLIPAFYASIAVHELGHLLAGSLVGMPPGGLVIGGIVIFKSGRRWIIRFEPRRVFGGGLAKALPQKDSLRLASFGWMVAGVPSRAFC